MMAYGPSFLSIKEEKLMPCVWGLSGQIDTMRLGARCPPKPLYLGCKCKAGLSLIL